MVRKVTVLDEEDDEEDDDEEKKNDRNDDLTVRKYVLDLDLYDDDINNCDQRQNQNQSHCIDVIPMGQNHNVRKSKIEMSLTAFERGSMAPSTKYSALAIISSLRNSEKFTFTKVETPGF